MTYFNFYKKFVCKNFTTYHSIALANIAYMLNVIVSILIRENLFPEQPEMESLIIV